jgi:hypothetical protein
VRGFEAAERDGDVGGHRVAGHVAGVDGDAARHVHRDHRRRAGRRPRRPRARRRSAAAGPQAAARADADDAVEHQVGPVGQVTHGEAAGRAQRGQPGEVHPSG